VFIDIAKNKQATRKLLEKGLKLKDDVVCKYNTER